MRIYLARIFYIHDIVELAPPSGSLREAGQFGDVSEMFRRCFGDVLEKWGGRNVFKFAVKWVYSQIERKFEREILIGKEREIPQKMWERLLLTLLAVQCSAFKH